MDGGVLDPAVDFLNLLPNSLALSGGATLELGRTIAFVSGIEMSFTDDGTLTGGAPGDDTERYYQVFVE